MQNRRACDRCYRSKEKCNFEDNPKTCKQCERAASTCTNLRLQLRQGRRPKVKPLGPQGTFQVWGIDSIENKPAKTVTGQIAIGIEVPRPLSTRLLTYNGAKKVSTPVQQTSRTKKTLIHQNSSPSPYIYHITPEEYPFDPWYPGIFEKFYKNYDEFMFGPTFAPEFRAAVQYSYLCSPALLRDILSAIEPIINRARKNANRWDDIEIVKGTKSLQKLRTVQVTGIKDSLAVILLGQTLAAFDLLTNCTSLSSTFILRYSLSTIQPWYEELSINPVVNPITVASIFWDTIHCLVRCEMPVIKFSSRGFQVVDRMAGLCTSLLPTLYDLCVMSHKLKYQSQMGYRIDASCITEIAQRFSSWIPERPDNYFKAFTKEEILRMEAQASIYRTAALLVCHRLLNPIGTGDDVARSYADSIMLDFSKYLTMVGPGVRLKNITFPIFMASLEIPDVSKEVWEGIALSAVAPTCVAKILDFVDYVWMERNRGRTKYLFDFVDGGPDFVIIP